MKHTIVRLAAAVAVALALLGVAGCGISGTGGADRGVAPNATPSASTSTATQVATGGDIVSGQVTVTLDKTAYASTDPITVYVNNGLSAKIFTTDHQTACTIVALQQNVGGGWRTVGMCRLMTPTRFVPLAARTTTVVRLGGNPSQLAGSPWTAGTYRIQFTYSHSGPPSGGVSPAYSAEFSIA